MRDIIELGHGPRTWDGRVNWAYWLAFPTVGLLPAFLIFAVYVMLHSMHPIADEGWPKLIFGYGVLLLFTLPFLGFALLMLGEMLGRQGVVIELTGRRVIAWRRNFFLRRTETVYSLDDFQSVNVFCKSIKVRYGYSHGFAVKLAGKDKEVELKFFEKLDPAQALADGICRHLQLSGVREADVAVRAAAPYNTAPLIIIGLIMFGLSFLSTHQSVAWIWAWRSVVLFFIAASIVQYRPRRQPPE